MCNEISINKKHVDLLYHEVLYAKAQFVIFDKMYKEEFSDNFKYYNICVLDALENSIILKLAKIYDDDKNSITLLKVLNQIQSIKELNNDKNIIKNFCTSNIEKIKNLDACTRLNEARNKVFAHLDKKYKEGIIDLNNKKDFYYSDIEELISYAYKLLHSILKNIHNENISDDNCFKVLEYENNEIRRIFNEFKKIKRDS